MIDIFTIGFYSCILLCFACESGERTFKNQEKSSQIFDKFEISKNHKMKSFQTFVIDSKIDQKISGKWGTTILFNTNCFIEFNGEVKISLIECYSIQDMIFHNLSTQTNNLEILTSAGMIYINALSEAGDTLNVKSNQVEIQMPFKTRKKNVKVFEGIQTKESITWRISQQKLLNLRSVKDTFLSKYAIATELEEDSTSNKKDSVIRGKIMLNNLNVKNEYLTNYVFNVQKMGWINCDSYIPGKTLDLNVLTTDNHDNVSLYLILDKFNSCVTSNTQERKKNNFLFKNMLCNESFKILAVANKDGKIYCSLSSYNRHNGNINCPELTFVSRSDFLNLLEVNFGTNIWNKPL